MTGIPLYLIAALVLLFILSAFFSASETALTAISKVRLRQLRKSNNKRDRLIVFLLDNPSRLITTLLVGNNIVNIWATSIATAAALAIAGPDGLPAATMIIQGSFSYSVKFSQKQLPPPEASPAHASLPFPSLLYRKRYSR